jgi:hypothetical protein
MDNRTVAFLARVPVAEVSALLVKQVDKNSSTNDKECVLSGLQHQGSGYCQVTFPAERVKSIFAGTDPKPGVQLKISLHQLAALVLEGPRPENHDAHHACRNRNCFRWTPDSLGRKHITWVSEEIHKTIMCPIKLEIDVACGVCKTMIRINVCTDPVTRPHLGPSCF